MLLTVLAVSECPHVDLLLDRIRTVLDGRAVDLEVVVVSELGEAQRRGMTGSPTLLVDGVDPFPVPGLEASLSCRLYRAADGSVSGLPSAAELEAAILGLE